MAAGRRYETTREKIVLLTIGAFLVVVATFVCMLLEVEIYFLESFSLPLEVDRGLIERPVNTFGAADEAVGVTMLPLRELTGFFVISEFKDD